MQRSVELLSVAAAASVLIPTESGRIAILEDEAA
jgi:hypothetical protein